MLEQGKPTQPHVAKSLLPTRVELGGFERPEHAACVYFYLLAIPLICLLKSIVLVRAGASYGRLNIPPIYDDVTYFVDALGRVQILLEKDVWHFAQSLVVNPPHAPYSTLAASLGFLFFGVDPNGSVPAAPYLVNGLVLGLMAGFLLFLFRIPPLTSCCIAIVFIALPWFDWSVTYFHPDLVAGFAAAVIGAALIWQSEVLATRKRAIIAGMAAAAALLIKPVGVGMLVALWTVGWFCGALLASREERSWKPSLIRLAFGIIPIAVLAGPYFIKQLPSILRYLNNAFVTQQKVWLHLLAPSENNLFYYYKQAEIFLGGFLLFAFAGAFANLLTGMAVSCRPAALRFGALMVVCAFAYIVPASVEVKKDLFGGVLYGCIVVTLILVIHFIVDRLRLTGPFDRTAAPTFLTRVGGWRGASLGVIFLLAFISIGDHQPRWEQDDRHAMRLVYDQLYGYIVDVASSSPAFAEPQANKPLAADKLRRYGTGPIVVYFSCPAPIAPHAFLFRGLANGLKFQVWITMDEDEIRALTDAATTASIVAIPDETYAKHIYPFPVMRHLPDLRNWLAKNDRLRLVGTIRTKRGNVDVYADRPIQR
jgi:hypothetical protein